MTHRSNRWNQVVTGVAPSALVAFQKKPVFGIICDTSVPWKSQNERAKQAIVKIPFELRPRFHFFIARI
jgi:hypothetical protein